MNTLLRWLLVLYTFLLPLQTRYFLVDSAVEYQRISIYGTQIFFAFVIVLYLLLTAKRKSQITNSKLQTPVVDPESGITTGQANSNDQSPKQENVILNLIQDPETNNNNKKASIFSFLDPLPRLASASASPWRDGSGKAGRSKFWMMIFFLLFFFISAQVIVSSRIDLTLQTLLWILQTALFIWMVRREKLEKVVLWAFVASMAVQSVFIWVQFFAQHIPAFKWFGLAEQISWQGGVAVVETLGGRFLRGYGFFPHPNIAGGFLLVAIITLTTLLSKHNSPQPSLVSREGVSPLKIRGDRGVMTFVLRATSNVLLALLVSGLVLTFSRSALLGLVIFIIFQLILSLSSSITSRLRHSGLGYDGRIEDPENRNKQKQTVIASEAIASVAISLDAQNEISTSSTSRNDRYFLFSFLDSCFRRNDGRGVIRFILTLLLFFLAVAIPLKYLVFSRIDSSSRLEQISISERVEYNSYARDIIKNNLWLGTGLGNYSVALQKIHPELESYNIQPPHSVPLLLLSELGIAGVVFFVLIIVGLLFYTLYPIPYTLLLAISPLFLFDHYAWSLYAGWALISLIVIVWSRRKANLES